MHISQLPGEQFPCKSRDKKIRGPRKESQNLVSTEHRYGASLCFNNPCNPRCQPSQVFSLFLGIRPFFRVLHCAWHISRQISPFVRSDVRAYITRHLTSSPARLTPPFRYLPPSRHTSAPSPNLHDGQCVVTATLEPRCRPQLCLGSRTISLHLHLAMGHLILLECQLIPA